VLVAVAILFPGRGPWWPLLVGIAAFAAEVVQIILGFEPRLALHVPLGVAIFGLVPLTLVGRRTLTRPALLAVAAAGAAV
jgi:hypothetical protein